MTTTNAHRLTGRISAATAAAALAAIVTIGPAHALKLPDPGANGYTGDAQGQTARAAQVRSAITDLAAGREQTTPVLAVMAVSPADPAPPGPVRLGLGAAGLAVIAGVVVGGARTRRHHATA